MSVLNLDMPISDLQRDRPTWHRFVRSIELDRGISFVDALEVAFQATESARAAGEPTFRSAIQWASKKPENLETNMKLLDQRDTAVARAYSSALEQKPETVQMLDDAHGRVRLAAPELSDDIATAMSDPVERERRWQKMKTLDGTWTRDMFDQYDLASLQSGVDMVRTADRNARGRAAQAQAGAVAMQLDRSIAAAAKSTQRRDALGAELAAVTARAQQEVERAQPGGIIELDAGVSTSSLQAEIDEATRRWKTLSPEERSDPFAFTKLLEAESSSPMSFTELQAKIMLDASGELSPELRTLDAYTDAYRKRELQYARELEARKLDVPPGVHAGSHAIDRQVRERMKSLERPESEYIRTLTEMMAEGL